VKICHVILPAKARKYVFTGVGLCVCLCVCLIVDGFVAKFMGRTDGRTVI